MLDHLIPHTSYVVNITPNNMAGNSTSTSGHHFKTAVGGTYTLVFATVPLCQLCQYSVHSGCLCLFQNRLAVQNLLFGGPQLLLPILCAIYEHKTIAVFIPTAAYSQTMNILLAVTLPSVSYRDVLYNHMHDQSLA